MHKSLVRVAVSRGVCAGRSGGKSYPLGLCLEGRRRWQTKITWIFPGPTDPPIKKWHITHGKGQGRFSKTRGIHQLYKQGMQNYWYKINLFCSTLCLPSEVFCRCFLNAKSFIQIWKEQFLLYQNLQINLNNIYREEKGEGQGEVAWHGLFKF